MIVASRHAGGTSHDLRRMKAQTKERDDPDIGLLDNTIHAKAGNESDVAEYTALQWGKGSPHPKKLARAAALLKLTNDPWEKVTDWCQSPELLNKHRRYAHSAREGRDATGTAARGRSLVKQSAAGGNLTRGGNPTQPIPVANHWRLRRAPSHELQLPPAVRFRGLPRLRVRRCQDGWRLLQFQDLPRLRLHRAPTPERHARRGRRQRARAATKLPEQGRPTQRVRRRTVPAWP